MPDHDSAKHWHILIVDDHEENRYLLETMLKRLGHEVTVASDGRQAMDKLGEGGIDLIISDILMPVMDGYQLCREVRSDKKMSGIPFIFFAASFVGKKDEEFAIKLGADRFLRKPMDPADFINQIQELMEEGGNPRGKTRPSEIAEEHEILKLYNERLVNNLETKMQDLEREMNQRKLAEEGTRRLATVVRDSNDAITVQDFEGRITAWNRGAELMYGYSEEEALKMNIGHLTPPAKEAEQKEFTLRLLAGEAVTSFETQRVAKDGRILDVWLTVMKLLDDAGKPIAIASTERDITKRKRSEEELKHLVEQLERSNQELEQFAHVASHDLQEPLRMISSYTQLLAEKYEGQLDEKAKKYIGYAVDGAIRMQKLIDDLLIYSRVGTRGEPPAFADVHSIVGEAVRNLSVIIEENRAIITNDDLPTVRATASQLVQVFQNLIANSVKFRSMDPPHIHVSAYDNGREWVFSIKDNGIGIDMQYAERIFVIFQRLHTRTEYAGTGIGLAICKRIVERHDGRIWAESEPAKGSTFYFTLPRSRGDKKSCALIPS